MKNFYSRYLNRSLILTVSCIAIMFALIKTDCVAAGGRIIYTAATGGTSEDSGDGTKSNPYNLFDTALKNANDGDTIYILEPMGFLNATDNSPYIINKSVTIKGDGSLFLIRSAGIVLGADVTFENVVINFGNRYHDAIFANGYTLSLNNVSCENGSRQVDIFGGGLYMNGKSVAQSGSKAQIIMTGGGENFGNIYAGTMNGVYSGNVTISLTNLESAANMVINASGADETYVNVDDFFNLEEPAPPTPNKNYTISGNVNITVDNCNVCQIEQISANASALCNLTVQTNGEYNGLIAAKNMDSIIVKGGGIFAPAELTNGTAVTLTEGSSLELSNISQPTLSSLVSQNSSRNRLILGKDQFVSITDSVKGKFIFETANGYNGYSGSAQYDFAYIRLETGAVINDTAFSFTCIPGMEMTLDKLTDYTVSGKTYSVVWKTCEESEYHPFPISGLEITTPTIITTVSDFYNSPVFDAKVTVPGDVTNGNYYFDLVPIRYEVTYNNRKYIGEAEFDGISYIANIPELHLTFMALSDAELYDAGICVYLYMDGSNNTPKPPAAGSYTINILPLSAGEQISETAHLIIVEDPGYESGSVEIKNTTTKLAVSVSDASINNKLTISATVKNSDGTNALNAPTTLYVNGKEYTNARLSTSGGNVSYTINATVDNGFVVGENDICILYQGAAGGQSASALSQGSTTLILKQLSAQMSYSAKNQSYKYTGSEINYSAGKVKITDSSNVLQDNVTPEIYYKKNGSIVTPIEPGTYDVFFSVTDELYGTLEEKAATLTIQAATPQITLTGKISSGKKLTLQAAVNGVSSAFIPVGTVNFYMDGSSIGRVNLFYGEADLSRQLKPGIYTFVAEYEPVYGNKEPYYTTQQSSEITVVVTESETAYTEENTVEETENITEEDSMENSESGIIENTKDDTETGTKYDVTEETENITEKDSGKNSETVTQNNTKGNLESSSENSKTKDAISDKRGVRRKVVIITISVVVIVSVLVFGCMYYIKKKN